MSEAVVVSARGAERWRAGHPWIYRGDVRRGGGPAGIVAVHDARGRPIGQALWSPKSEIRLRRLADAASHIDAAWWQRMIAAALARRAGTIANTDAYRVVHGEADGMPSLIVDRYASVAVLQLLSAGLEAVRDDVLTAVDHVLSPTAIVLRNDASVRRHEGLPLESTIARGDVPDLLDVREGNVRYRVDLRAGQKTGAFLDQRENRLLIGRLACGRALDLFTYEGLFALHMAGTAQTVMAVDQSAAALARAQENAALNARANISWVEDNAFDVLRRLERAGEAFDTVVLDPPAFAKQKSAVPRALAGYKEINLRAMRLLAPGGLLLTASCSFHVGRDAFLDMLRDAAADSGVRLSLERLLGQSADHPEVLTIPETGYLKGALLRRID